jgi:WRKY transcription factor 2
MLYYVLMLKLVLTTMIAMFQGQASPTTGTLFMLGGTNNSNPNRFEGPPPGDGPGAFSFKPLDLKSSHYRAEEKVST